MHGIHEDLYIVPCSPNWYHKILCVISWPLIVVEVAVAMVDMRYDINIASHM